MVEVSVVVPTTIEEDADIPVIEHLSESSFRDFEVIVRRDSGASKARNEGIKRASGEKIVFLDDDSRPIDGYLEAASKALDEHVAVAGRVIQPPDDPFADMDIPWYDQGTEPKLTTMVVGCNMAVRRGVLDEIGGFDETFNYGHEEYILAQRILDKYDIYYDPSMVVEHAYADSIPGFWRKEFRHGKADVLLWEAEDWALRKRFTQSMKMLLPAKGPVKTVGGIYRVAGRLFGLVMRRTSSR